MSGATKREPMQKQVQPRYTREERERLARERFESHFGEINVPPHSLASAARDFRGACRRLFLEVAYALRLERLTDWLDRKLRRVRDGNGAD